MIPERLLCSAGFQERSDERLRNIRDELQAEIRQNGTVNIQPETINLLVGIADKSVTSDTLLLSDAYYIAGYLYLQEKEYDKAILYLTKTVSLREKSAVIDRRLFNTLTNIAGTYFYLGNYSSALESGQKALATGRKIAAADSSLLVKVYLNLSSITLELNDFENAIKYAEAGIHISEIYPDRVDNSDLADLYQDLGLTFYRNSEYTKSLVYLKEAVKKYSIPGSGKIESELLVYNTLGMVYRRMGQPDLAEKYFKIALDLGSDKYLTEKFLINLSYSYFLFDSGKVSEADRLIETELEKFRKVYGTESREFSMMLAAQADFVQRTSGDKTRALDIYRRAMKYTESHPWDISLKRYILLEYAGTLFESGQAVHALQVTDTIMTLNHGQAAGISSNNTDSLVYTPDNLNLLLLRYRIQNALAHETGEISLFNDAISTGKTVVAFYDRQRNEMSEEESRTNLSSFSRDLYTGILDNYTYLYSLTGDKKYLDGAFEFSERSKVAGFLASMREINAAKLSLPHDLAELDNNIRRDIGIYRELIVKENSKINPDSLKVATWESLTFRLLRSRDSLVKIFETKYPAYYSLKFRSSVTPLEDVKKVIGQRSNLISYILTDDKLYIFVINGSKREVLTRNIDSSFVETINRFRQMLTSMPATTGVREPFNEYMDLGYQLYRTLIEPAIPYLRGNKIIISPDNILAYIPFETLITEEFRSPDLLYRDAPFTLKKYLFSYIYSVTFSSEIPRRSRSLRNDLVAYAPAYEGMEISDSVLMLYPNLRGEIRSLPYATMEAEDAVKQCGGIAYTADLATEDSFKQNAGKYDIVHLAMHTLVDDSHPAFSKMIFSASPEGKDDGMLNTYEVYNIPLKAMMVVLSSCNTGTGLLATGEGILSLARGFIFAGSRSVVMSMWAVDDYSASEVVRSFYRNLRSGKTKSSALRSARLSFLRSADQARSHPYYWSTLVIYGDDTAMWYNRIKLYIALLFFFTAGTVLTAIIYRGPRS